MPFMVQKTLCFNYMSYMPIWFKKNPPQAVLNNCHELFLSHDRPRKPKEPH
jgi:hypothetical protein